MNLLQVVAKLYYLVFLGASDLGEDYGIAK